MHLGPFQEFAGIAPGHEIGLVSEEIVFAVLLAHARGAGGKGHGMADVRACLQQCAHQRGLSGAGRRRDDED